MKYLNLRKNILSILFQEAQEFAEENGLLFKETSAKTAMNVHEIFMEIGKLGVVTNVGFKEKGNTHADWGLQSLVVTNVGFKEKGHVSSLWWGPSVFFYYYFGIKPKTNFNDLKKSKSKKLGQFGLATSNFLFIYFLWGHDFFVEISILGGTVSSWLTQLTLKSDYDGNHQIVHCLSCNSSLLLN